MADKVLIKLDFDLSSGKKQFKAIASDMNTIIKNLKNLESGAGGAEGGLKGLQSLLESSNAKANQFVRKGIKQTIAAMQQLQTEAKKTGQVINQAAFTVGPASAKSRGGGKKRQRGGAEAKLTSGSVSYKSGDVKNLLGESTQAADKMDANLSGEVKKVEKTVAAVFQRIADKVNSMSRNLSNPGLLVNKGLSVSDKNLERHRAARMQAAADARYRARISRRNAVRGTMPVPDTTMSRYNMRRARRGGASQRRQLLVGKSLIGGNEPKRMIEQERAIEAQREKIRRRDLKEQKDIDSKKEAEAKKHSTVMKREENERLSELKKYINTAKRVKAEEEKKQTKEKNFRRTSMGALKQFTSAAAGFSLLEASDQMLRGIDATRVSGVLDNIFGNLLGGLGSLIGETASKIFMDLGSAVGNLTEAVVNLVLGTVRVLAAGAAGIFKGIARIVTASVLVPLEVFKSALFNIGFLAVSGFVTIFSGVISAVSQIFKEIGTVVGSILKAVSNVVSAAFESMLTIIRGIGKSIISVFKGVWSAVKQIVSMSLQGIQAAIGKTLELISSAVSKFIQLQSGAAKILSQVVDIAGESIDRFEGMITKAGVAFGNSFDSTSEAMFDIVSSGYRSSAEAATIYTASAKLAAAAHSDVANSTNTLITVLQNFDGDLSNINDRVKSLSAAVTLSRATLQDFGPALRNVAGLASRLNLDFDDLLVSVSALTRVFGRGSAQESGRFLNRLLEAIAIPSSKSRKELKKLGIEVTSTGNAFDDFLSIIKQFENVEPGDLRTFFPTVQSRKAILGLTKDVKGIFKLREEQKRLKSSFDEQFQVMQNTAGKSIDRIKAAWDAAFYTLGKPIVMLIQGPLKKLADALERVFDKFNPETIAPFAKRLTDFFGPLLNKAVNSAISVIDMFLAKVESINLDAIFAKDGYIMQVKIKGIEALALAVSTVKRIGVELNYVGKTWNNLWSSENSRSFLNIFDTVVRSAIDSFGYLGSFVIDVFKNVTETIYSSFDALFGDKIKNFFVSIVSQIFGTIANNLEQLRDKLGISENYGDRALAKTLNPVLAIMREIEGIDPLKGFANRIQSINAEMAEIKNKLKNVYNFDMTRAMLTPGGAAVEALRNRSGEEADLAKRFARLSRELEDAIWEREKYQIKNSPGSQEASRLNRFNQAKNNISGLVAKINESMKLNFSGIYKEIKSAWITASAKISLLNGKNEKERAAALEEINREELRIINKFGKYVDGLVSGKAPTASRAGKGDDQEKYKFTTANLRTVLQSKAAMQFGSKEQRRAYKALEGYYNLIKSKQINPELAANRIGEALDRFVKVSKEGDRRDGLIKLYKRSGKGARDVGVTTRYSIALMLQREQNKMLDELVNIGKESLDFSKRVTAYSYNSSIGLLKTVASGISKIKEPKGREKLLYAISGAIQKMNTVFSSFSTGLESLRSVAGGLSAKNAKRLNASSKLSGYAGQTLQGIQAFSNLPENIARPLIDKLLKAFHNRLKQYGISSKQAKNLFGGKSPEDITNALLDANKPENNPVVQKLDNMEKTVFVPMMNYLKQAAESAKNVDTKTYHVSDIYENYSTGGSVATP